MMDDDDDGDDFMLGDLNGDKIINSLDATLMSRLILEMDDVEANRKVKT